MRTTKTLGLAILLVAGLFPSTMPVADGAEPCRVRNATQGTSEDKLGSMVGHAHAGDRLTLHGTCVVPLLGIAIDRDLVITGVGRRPTVTGLDKEDRSLRVARGATVVIRGLIIERVGIGNGGRLRLMRSVVQDGLRFEGGGTSGGIINGGRLTIVDSIVRRNRHLPQDSRETGRGGGIWHQPDGRTRKFPLILKRTVVVGNVADDLGGGIYVVRGSVRIVDSVIRGNGAGDGGGLFVTGGDEPLATIVDSVIRDNRADRGGGIFGRAADTVLVGSTVTRNTASLEGGGIFIDEMYGGSVTLDAASSVAGNTPDDCVGTPACRDRGEL